MSKFEQQLVTVIIKEKVMICKLNVLFNHLRYFSRKMEISFSKLDLIASLTYD